MIIGWTLLIFRPKIKFSVKCFGVGGCCALLCLCYTGITNTEPCWKYAYERVLWTHGSIGLVILAFSNLWTFSRSVFVHHMLAVPLFIRYHIQSRVYKSYIFMSSAWKFPLGHPPSVCLFVCPSICLHNSARPSICLYIIPSVCLSVPYSI